MDDLIEIVNKDTYYYYGTEVSDRTIRKDISYMMDSEGYSAPIKKGMVGHKAYYYYSDPDFSAKLYHAGVRLFKGIDRSRVYHFEARSTHRIIKNDGSLQFLRKWGITSASFMRDILHRGEPWSNESQPSPQLKKDLLRSRLKRALTIFRDVKIKNIWEY